MNAQKNGFFSDDNSFTYVDVGNETTTDVVLSPHAWLEVTLKNESGAYQISSPGENGDSNSREFYLNQNQETVFIIFRGGNKDLKYGFDILDTPNHVLDDFSNVKVNGGAIPIIKEGNVCSNYPVIDKVDTDNNIISGKFNLTLYRGDDYLITD